MRLRAYQQLLQSYRVVGLDSMANDFGVTVDFLDRFVIPALLSTLTPSFLLSPSPSALNSCKATLLTLFRPVAISPSLSLLAASLALSTVSPGMVSLRPTDQTIRTSSTRRLCARATS